MQSAIPSPAVRVSNVSLNYYTPERETLALSNVSLDIEEGDFVAIVGSSGCGKSTLLSLVSGLIRPSQGDISVGGKLVYAPSPKVGYMFQKDTLLEWRTVLENALIGAELLGLDMKKAKARAQDLLIRYGLGEFLHAYPAQLSGGMRQRAALARTLAVDPAVLLMDEPFSALDAQTKMVLQQDLGRTLAEAGKTALFVTHDLVEAIALSHRVLVMSDRPGRIIREIVIDIPDHGNPMARRKHRNVSGYINELMDLLHIEDAVA
jgi:NitT/TauT family transport system ATP-binding protein